MRQLFIGLLGVMAIALVAVAAHADDNSALSVAPQSLPVPCEVVTSQNTDLQGEITPTFGGKPQTAADGSQNAYMTHSYEYQAGIQAWSIGDKGVQSSSIYSTASDVPEYAHLLVVQYGVATESTTPLPPNVDAPNDQFTKGVLCSASPLPASCLQASQSVVNQANARLAQLKTLGVCR